MEEKAGSSVSNDPLVDALRGLETLQIGELAIHGDPRTAFGHSDGQRAGVSGRRRFGGFLIRIGGVTNPYL
jgi:hypothetical protein